MKTSKAITKEMIKEFLKEYEEDKTAKVYTAAAATCELTDLAFYPDAASKFENSFSVEIKTRGITAQKDSGRCWLFASMNILRERVAETCNLEMFELSGNYLAFWDKFEKMNFFLESVIDSADLDISDRTVNWLMAGIQDGGQWDMMVSLIKKYGIVPKSVMPENYQSTHTNTFLNLINMKLRKNTVELRKLVQEGKDASARKNEMLGELFKALCICFGKPVEKFDFSYTDKENKFHVDHDLTPQQFYEKYVGLSLDDYVSIINSPTKDKPYEKSYTVKYLGNVVEGNIRYLNLSMEDLKALVVKQLKAGEPVWFGSDCGKFGIKSEGIWDPDSFVYGELLGDMDLTLTKEQRLDYRDSAMDHAMVFNGVNLNEDGKPDRWKIENSWGEEVGKKGYFIASDKWFDEFVYQAIIDKKYLKDKWKDLLQANPIELEPWDPMGTLA